MTTIREKNFTATPVAEIPVADVYERCNFARLQSTKSGPNQVGERLFPGDDTPRTFIDCNLMNCEPPPGSTLTRCNTWIVDTGETPAAKADDVVEVDGVEVSRTVYHDRTVHGRYVDGAYDRTGYPQTMPEDY